MRKRRQIEAINGEFQLPEPILHRIQSFLSSWEAPQTAVLSKSWRSAWLTRPNLDLDQHDLGIGPQHDLGIGPDDDYKLDEFSELAKKTIQRYEQSNLKIESFRLWTMSRVDVDSGDFASDLIRRALKIGATHLDFQDYGREVVLPQEVFEAENLVGLSLNGCKIEDLGFGRKVRCSKLESLSLRFVMINSEMISNIASCCPLIGKLLLWDISSFNDDDDHAYCSFLGDLSSRFPSLKDLTLGGCETQQISSRSLERLDFYTCRSRLSVKFDVPSIRKFRFEGDDIPSLSFVSAPREWEADIFIKDCDTGLSTLWFRRLNKFLTESSLSKIHLTLWFDSFKSKICEYEVGDIRGLPKRKVENLTISMTDQQALRCFALFHGLFQICRPKFITLDYYKSIYALLCKTLARGLDDKYMYGLHDLEEVNVHLFDKHVDAWQPLPLKSVLDPSISQKGDEKIRFQLKWKT